MPNNTYTEVRLQGPTPIIDKMGELLKAIATNHSKHPGFLKTFVGDPNENYAKELNSRRVQAWGTKWDVYYVRDVHTQMVPEHAGFAADSILTCKWHTAWNPCIQALIELSKDHKVDSTIRYLDECYMYAGITTIINGHINKEYICTREEDMNKAIYSIFGEDAWVSEFQLAVENNADLRNFLEGDYVTDDMKARCEDIMSITETAVNKQYR